MITIDKINIYKKYGGDIDMWARVNSKTEHSIMEDNDWYEIDTLIQALTLIKNRVVSKEFENKTNDKLIASISERRVADELRNLA